MIQSKIILVTGGQACGKSSFAQKIAETNKGKKFYIATALPIDEEIKAKIQRHQQQRGNAFITIEEPMNLHNPIQKAENSSWQSMVIDCLTMWAFNLLTKFENNPSLIEEHMNKFVNALKNFKNANRGTEKTNPKNLNKKIVIVTNEVGWGIIPPDPLSRRYVELLGKINKEIANIADTVYLMVSGIALQVKG